MESVWENPSQAALKGGDAPEQGDTGEGIIEVARKTSPLTHHRHRKLEDVTLVVQNTPTKRRVKASVVPCIIILELLGRTNKVTREQILTLMCLPQCQLRTQLLLLQGIRHNMTRRWWSGEKRLCVTVLVVRMTKAVNGQVPLQRVSNDAVDNIFGHRRSNRIEVHLARWEDYGAMQLARELGISILRSSSRSEVAQRRTSRSELRASIVNTVFLALMTCPIFILALICPIG